MNQFTSSFPQCFAKIYAFYIYIYTSIYFSISFFWLNIISYFSPLANFTLTGLERWQVIFSCGFPTLLWIWLRIPKQSCHWSHLLTDKATSKQKSYRDVQTASQELHTIQCPEPVLASYQRGANCVLHNCILPQNSFNSFKFSMRCHNTLIQKTDKNILEPLNVL